MGIRAWGTRLIRFLRPERGTGAAPPPPGLTRAEQDSDREDRRRGTMSEEDLAWEQASLQRSRERESSAPNPNDQAGG